MVPGDVLRLAGSYLEVGSRFLVLWKAFSGSLSDSAAAEREERFGCAAAAEAAGATRGALLAVTEAVAATRQSCPDLPEWCSAATAVAAEAGLRWELVLALLLGALFGVATVAGGIAVYLKAAKSFAPDAPNLIAPRAVHPTRAPGPVFFKEGGRAPRAEGSPRQLARLGLEVGEQRILTPSRRRNDVA